MAKGDSLADQLFNRNTVDRLARHFEDAGIFAAQPFVDAVMVELPNLALKERINHVAEHLERFLPREFSEAEKAIRASLPAPLAPDLKDNDFGHFIYAPIGVFVEKHGVKAHFERSLSLLVALTQRFSMEFSLRAFLNADQAASLSHIHRWAESENYHVRRLASEGTRPRLPWGKNVGLDVADTLPILDKLYADPTRFVTRSVANHLNDISKIDPDSVIDRLTKWAREGKQTGNEMDWITRHALRSLVKSGHGGALELLGYRPDAQIVQAGISIPTAITINDRVKILVTIVPEADGPLMIDYVIDFMKANGKHSAKVFKLKSLAGKAKVEVTLEKSHHFDGTATTFKLHKGAHSIHLQVNGRIVASQAFVLT